MSATLLNEHHCARCGVSRRFVSRGFTVLVCSFCYEPLSVEAMTKPITSGVRDSEARGPGSSATALRRPIETSSQSTEHTQNLPRRASGETLAGTADTCRCEPEVAFTHESGLIVCAGCGAVMGPEAPPMLSDSFGSLVGGKVWT